MQKRIVLFGSPSGGGKNAIIDELIRKYPNYYTRFPSMASRAMRQCESQGNPYIFVTNQEFEQKIASGEVFEYTTLHGDYRGMSSSIIDHYLEKDKILLKDCDYIGVIAVKKKYPGQVMSIFLDVPKKELERRIRQRGSMPEELIKHRLSNYDKETQTKKHFELVVKNIVLEESVEHVHNLITMQTR